MLSEAVVVGFVGSTVGIGVGYLLAIGLRALFGTFGLDLGGSDLTMAPRTVLVSYAVGIVVTVIAAYLPARRAGRIAPVVAMRDDAALPESSLRRRLLVGAAMIAAGIGLMVGGFAGSGGTGLLLIGLGMLGILVGVSLIAPVLGRPVIRGWVWRTGACSPRSARSPPRTRAATHGARRRRRAR